MQYRLAGISKGQPNGPVRRRRDVVAIRPRNLYAQQVRDDLSTSIWPERPEARTKVACDGPCGAVAIDRESFDRAQGVLVDALGIPHCDKTAAVPTREAAWARAVARYPGYAAYRRRVGREIPVVLLEPLS